MGPQAVCSFGMQKTTLEWVIQCRLVTIDWMPLFKCWEISVIISPDWDVFGTLDVSILNF